MTAQRTPEAIATPPGLLRAVHLDYLAANQLLAGAIDRLAWLRMHEDTAPEAAQIHRGIVALREAFRTELPTEAALDAAHEASVAEMRELAEAEDAPLADPGDHFVYPVAHPDELDAEELHPGAEWNIAGADH